MSLARRITILVLIVSVTTSALTFALVVGFARQASQDAAIDLLGRDADLLAGVAGGGPVDGRVGVDAVQRALEDRQVTSVVVGIDQPDAVIGVGPFTPEDVTSLATGAPLSDIRAVDRRRWLVVGRQAGDSAVLVAQPLEVATSFVPASRRRALLAAAIGAVIGAVGGAVLARTVTRPLVNLDSAARRLATGERGVRVQLDGPPEIADVAQALNGLSDALALSEDRQRRFLLTVSHELRTPLTAVSGYAEALADGVVSGPDVANAGRVIRDEAARLQRRVEELLALARLEADDVTIEIVEVDVTHLIRAAFAAWSARSAALGVTLVLEVPAGAGTGPGGVWASADPERLRQAVDALVDNALRVIAAQPPGDRGPVVLAARADPDVGDGAVVEVRDGGPGLAPEELAVAFEPGLLTERYRGERPVGSGVGLALVGRLARLMGGGAVATTAPEGGVAVTIRLPPARAVRH